ncbi:hypothetical protein ONR67_06175 [Proteus terrae]|uniref:hypothetical protein n=2 Tax=Proteus terrae TaxID=1574161 RepID=UPI0023314922|nr:hypothetical protein [Proteus terrae]WCG91609.1 hypothetical protein ONR67_06175 [Proteus terrae]
MKLVDNMNDKSKEITLYAYVDELLEIGYQDYFPHEKSLKLTTIIKDNYLNNSFNEVDGCNTQNVDINISDKNKDIMYRSIICSYDKINLNLIKKLISIFEKTEPKDKIDINKLEAITPSIRSLGAIILINYIIMKKRMGFLKSDLILVEEQRKHIWMKIKANLDNNGDSYFYETFNSDEKEIKYIAITSIEFILGEELNRSESISIQEENKLKVFMENIDIKFYSFHVGQGMCSLLTSGDKGILFDMGAGKPILRKNYTTLITNELANELLSKLNAVYVFLSHLDSDHSRLMEWEISLGKDKDFQEKIINIFIPHMQKSLSFKNKEIIKKVIEIDKDIFIKNNLIEMNIYRSNPNEVKKNNDCIIIKINFNNNTILIPGDYVYKEMNKDNNDNIKSIPTEKFNIIIVPHHGDEASSEKIPTPLDDNSQAYFSAGTHLGYNHPRKESIQGHEEKGFKVIHDKQCSVIKIAISTK